MDAFLPTGSQKALLMLGNGSIGAQSLLARSHSVLGTHKLNATTAVFLSSLLQLRKHPLPHFCCPAHGNHSKIGRLSFLWCVTLGQLVSRYAMWQGSWTSDSMQTGTAGALAVLKGCSALLHRGSHSGGIHFISAATVVCTQDLTLAKQELYYMSHTPNSFFFALVIFQIEFHIFFFWPGANFIP
jgi:hypothetical protein